MRRTINWKRHTGKLLIILTSVLLGASACSSDRSAPVEATAQASRVQSLATQVANNLRSTQAAESLQAEATVQAVQSLLAQSQEWPILIDERFDQNDRNWPTGEEDDRLATILWEIRDGQYHWQSTAKEAFVWWAFPDMEPYANFFLAVELQQLEGPPTGEAGLVFRLSDVDFYLFEINASQQWSFYFHNQEGWEAIQEWQDTEAIAAGGPTRLSVIADQANMLLFINDRYLTTLVDTRLTGGEAGVLAGLSNPEDEAGWTFDNFILRAESPIAP